MTLCHLKQLTVPKEQTKCLKNVCFQWSTPRRVLRDILSDKDSLAVYWTHILTFDLVVFISDGLDEFLWRIQEVPFGAHADHELAQRQRKNGRKEGSEGKKLHLGYN